MNIRVTTDGKLYEVDENNKTARYLGETEAATKETVANIGAKTDETVAGIGAKATTDAATIRADADKSVAQTVTEGKAAEGAADRAMSYDIEKLRANTQIYSDDIKRDIAEQGYTSAEKIAQWTLANKAYTAELEAGGGARRGTVELGLSPGQVDRVDALAADYNADKDYQALQKLQREFERATEAYARVKEEALDPKNENRVVTGSSDVALINIFQRFIDPGVSVREGDVELLQKTTSFIDELKLKLNRARDSGYKLTPASRKEMYELIDDFYGAAMSRMSEDLTTRYTQRIELDGELKGSGVTVSHLGTDYWERYGSTLAGARGRPGADGTADPDPTAPTPGLQEPDADTEEAERLRLEQREQTVEKSAQYAIERGWDIDKLRQFVLERWNADGRPVDEELLQAILDRFTLLTTEADDEGEEPAEPEEPEEPLRNRQDFRNRGVQ